MNVERKSSKREVVGDGSSESGEKGWRGEGERVMHGG